MQLIRAGLGHHVHGRSRRQAFFDVVVCGLHVHFFNRFLGRNDQHVVGQPNEDVGRPIDACGVVMGRQTTRINLERAFGCVGNGIRVAVGDARRREHPGGQEFGCLEVPIRAEGEVLHGIAGDFGVYIGLLSLQDVDGPLYGDFLCCRAHLRLQVLRVHLPDEHRDAGDLQGFKSARRHFDRIVALGKV